MLVIGAAIVRHGRVLATRRTHPPEAAGRWELPGGKVEPGESPEHAVVREVHEELGYEVAVTGRLAGAQPVGDGGALRVLLAEPVAGEPVPREHDALRWLGPEELDRVAWLAPDLPFLDELRERLLDGTRLEGGNVAGAVRIGRTVRRPVGPWTPAVHGLLDRLAVAGLRAVPRVLGTDARDREVLAHLPGRVVDADTQTLSDAQLADLVRWLSELHEATADLPLAGGWRDLGVEGATVVGHNDLAPYNVCWEGDRLVGVFDWDLAGPSTPLLELGHLAWSGVPLFRDVPAAESARRLRLMADAYGDVDARTLLDAVPARVRLTVDVVRGTEQALAGLREPLPSIAEELS